MEIALHTTENKTVIALKKGGKIAVLRSFNPKMIFQDPNLVRERFLQIIKNSFEIEDIGNLDRLIFSIPGTISERQGLIIESDELNQISVFKSFSGFSFKECFCSDISVEKIFLVSSSTAITYGVQRELSKLSKPILVLTDENTTGIGLVWTDNSIYSLNWSQKLLPGYNNASISKVIGKKGIEDIIYAGSTDVMSDYLERFISTIPVFVDQLNIFAEKLGLFEVKASLGQKFKSALGSFSSFIGLKSDLISFVVFTNFSSLIEDRLQSQFQGLAKVKFIDNEELKGKIPIVGCFEAVQNLGSKDKIVERVDYYANGEKAYSFNNFSEFSNHWESVKSFANDKNYYEIFYSDGNFQTKPVLELKYDKSVELLNF